MKNSIQPEFQALLKELMKDWRLRLLHRYNSRPSRHDDILQDTAEDLIIWVNKFDLQWSDESIRRVSFKILDCRIADDFRKTFKEWAVNSSIDEINEVLEIPDNSSYSDPVRMLHLSQILRGIIGSLSELPPLERAMILSKELGEDPIVDPRSSGARREHLSRIRKKIVKLLRENYRISLSDPEES